MSSFGKGKPMRNASLLRSQLIDKIASERARLCANITQSLVNERGDKSPQGPLRDEFLLWKALDDFQSAMSDMIDGDSFDAANFLIDLGEDDRFEIENSLHEFLSGGWQPNYTKWLDFMGRTYPLPPTENEKKQIEDRIDSEARTYQAHWENEHGRPWPAPAAQNDRNS